MGVSEREFKVFTDSGPFQITSNVINNMPLCVAASPTVLDLWKELGESTYLAVLRQNEVIYVSHLDSTKVIRISGMIGGCYPLHCTAPGKAILAYCNDHFISDVASSPLKKYTENSIVDKDSLIAELNKIREQGYAIDNEEYAKGCVCFSAPIFSYNHMICAAIGISTPSAYCPVDKLYETYGRRIIAASELISKNMGYRDINNDTYGKTFNL